MCSFDSGSGPCGGKHWESKCPHKLAAAQRALGKSNAHLDVGDGAQANGNGGGESPSMATLELFISQCDDCHDEDAVAEMGKSCAWKLRSPPATSPGGGGNTTICDGCMSCADQVKYAPDPRFDLGALAKYKTPYNFNWMDPWNYMAGMDVPRALKYNVTKDMMIDLAMKWR